MGFGDGCVPICPEGQINKPPTGQCGCQEVPGGVLQICGNKCVDTLSDEDNCGTCGKACASGQACTGGQCTQCPAGQHEGTISGAPACVPNCGGGQTNNPDTGECECRAGQHEGTISGAPACVPNWAAEDRRIIRILVSVN